MGVKETILIWYSWKWRGLIPTGLIYSIYSLIIVANLKGSDVNIILLLVAFLLYVIFPLLCTPLNIWVLKIALFKRYKIYTEEISYKQAFEIWWSWIWRFIIVSNIIFALEYLLGYNRIYLRFIDGKLSAISLNFFATHYFPGNAFIFITSLYFLHRSLKQHFYPLLLNSRID